MLELASLIFSIAVSTKQYQFSVRDSAISAAGNPILRPCACHAHLGFLRESEAIARRLKATDPSLVPNADQFRDAEHRELLTRA